MKFGEKLEDGSCLAEDLTEEEQAELANYIYDACKSDIEGQPTAIEQEYQAPPQVSFTIAVEDSCGVVRKEYSYDGPAKDIQEVTQHVEKLWNEDAAK